MLHAVTLDKTDTCLTYALKRTGHSLPKITDSDRIDDFFTLEPFNTWEELNPGDILVYSERERYATMPDTITAEGRILSNRRLILRHFAVYEGLGIVSDCTISSQDYPFCKTIRMQHINTAPRPTSVMRPNK